MKEQEVREREEESELLRRGLIIEEGFHPPHIRISEIIVRRKRLESNTDASLSSLVMCQRRELTENNWISFWP